MRLRGRDGAYPVNGLVFSLLGRLRIRAIIGPLVAVSVFINPHQSGHCAEPVRDVSDSLLWLEQSSDAAPAVKFELTREDLTGNSQPPFDSHSLTGVDHVHADHDVVPMAYTQ